MHTLIDQLEISLNSRLYFLSLYAALTIPDIAGALVSDNGEASGKKYAAWFEQWIRPQFKEIMLNSMSIHQRQHILEIENPLTGDDCYRFRCSLLHQGSSQHSKSQFSRIMFIEPGATTNRVHYGLLGDALCIDLVEFCNEIILGARLWLKQAEHEANFIKNYERFARRHATGIHPYIGGVPVVG